MSEGRRIRIRGIYATALTRAFLDGDWAVVQASGPIERRFDAEFDAADHDVDVETTDDRQGVGAAGEPDAVADAADLLGDVGRDAFVWEDPAPVGAIFDGRVADTLGGGAVVDLGGAEGYLPFRNVDARVESGDRVRAQVVEGAPPWSDDRPLLDVEIRAFGGLATLVPGREETTVDGRDEAAARELAGITDLLGGDAPKGWGVRWDGAATEASMDALNAALDRATVRAEAIESALGGDPSGGVEPAGDEPGELVSPASGAWIWFGRESRFALDDVRRRVTPTMPGHHRIKAGTNAASAAVDFAEALCEPDASDEFPFGVAAEKFGPNEGDDVRIGHGKPGGRLIVLGTGTVVERGDDGTVAVERTMSPGGSYDALDVPRERGDVALTKFREGRWWYPTVYRSAEGDVKGTYVNVCTPVECFPDVVRYVDLHVDVIKRADGAVERVDDDELDGAVAAGHVSEPLAEKARRVASALEDAL